MGLFNWFSSQLERRTLKQQIDRLLADINEAAQEAAELRRELGATEHLLHEAQRGAELMVQTNEFLNAELKKWRDKCRKLEYENETFAAENDRVWRELNRLTDDVNKWKQAAEQPKTATGVTLETSETELEQRAWEIFVHGTSGHTGCFTQAKIWMSERDRRRKEQENQTSEQ